MVAGACAYMTPEKHFQSKKDASLLINLNPKKDDLQGLNGLGARSIVIIHMKIVNEIIINV